jgi:hypothetical protein
MDPVPEPAARQRVDGGMKAPHPKPDSGLANEPRPGLGAREDDGTRPLKYAKTKPSPQDDEPQGRHAPLENREPREQTDGPAHEAERDTGVSGHSGAD